MGCYPTALTRCVLTWNKKLDTHHTQKMNALFRRMGYCTCYFEIVPEYFYMPLFRSTTKIFYWPSSDFSFMKGGNQVIMLLGFAYLRNIGRVNVVLWYYIFLSLFYHQYLESFIIPQTLLFNSYLLNLWSSLYKWWYNKGSVSGRGLCAFGWWLWALA